MSTAGSIDGFILLHQHQRFTPNTTATIATNRHTKPWGGSQPPLPPQQVRRQQKKVREARSQQLPRISDRSPHRTTSSITPHDGPGPKMPHPPLAQQQLAQQQRGLARTNARYNTVSTIGIVFGIFVPLSQALTPNAPLTCQTQGPFVHQ